MRKFLKDFKKDKRGVFGLTAVQSFFAVILGIALLAYVIVVIMGTLSGSTILTSGTASVSSEVGFANTTGYTLSTATISGFSNPTITALINRTSGASIAVGNATVSALGVVTNASTTVWNNLSISYSYSYYTDSQNQLSAILGNTSTGITGFFSSINPVYSILAVLVIILVLVVLVRVVQAPNRRESPQL